jgi:hypothetical protein
MGVKTNYDRYREGQLADPEFRASYEETLRHVQFGYALGTVR